MSKQNDAAGRALAALESAEKSVVRAGRSLYDAGDLDTLPAVKTARDAVADLSTAITEKFPEAKPLRGRRAPAKGGTKRKAARRSGGKGGGSSE